MSYLPNGTQLNRISIPGTHDSGADCCGIAVRTQTWTIAEQLSAGVRFLDIRVRATGTAWAIHHADYYLDKMFGDVMNEVRAFLRANPTEVVFMRLKEDKGAADGASSHTDIWNKYSQTYSDILYRGDGTSWPTLGAVRGKAFIFSQISEVPTSYGMHWDSGTIRQDYYEVFLLAHDQTKGTSWATMPAKRRLVREYVDQARTPASGGSMVMNFLSGSTGMTPPNVADYTNDTAYDKIPYTGRAQANGVLVMDFPGEKLIYRIIKSNFASSCYATLFNDSSYGGSAVALTSTLRNIAKLSSYSFNDKLTSVRMDTTGCPGSYLEIYRHADYDSKILTLTTSTSNVGADFNDRASSVKFVIR